MKKKVFSLMMTLLLAFMGVAKAEVVTIGEGTSTTYVTPFNSLWGYSFVEQIFTADEIGTAGTINSISFNMQSTASQTNQVEVFMKNVSRSSFSGPTDYETVTTSDMVFSGNVTFSNGWTTIMLDTPFAYDGSSNLMIGMHEYTSGYSTRYFYYTSATDKVLSYHSDGANPDPYNLGSYTGNKYVSPNRANIQIDITPAGGSTDKLHVRYMEGADEVIDSLNLGVRPLGCWTEPFEFQMYTEGPAYTVNVLDFTPSDGMFTVEGEELPFQVIRTSDVDLVMGINATSAGVIERQFVAITEGNRAAHIWPVVVEVYDPLTPDVWEKACTEATSFPFVEVPATAHNITLHNDYTLPFPEIPEGLDAVYKLVFDNDVMLNAEVTYGENGKVALYREGFEGEGGPMAGNYYTGPQVGGAGGGAPFEAQIGEGTSTSTYFPFHTLWNYSLAENLFLASELTEAGVTTAPMTSLSWYVSSTTCTTPQNNISIWMANVDDAALSATSHTTNGMTLVYTGSSVLPTAGQWNEFVFNEGNFAWDGHSNILILCTRNNGSWQGSISWQTHNPGFLAMTYSYSDTNGGYDVSTTPYTGMYTSATNRANIIFKGGNRGANRQVVTYDFENQQIPAGWTNDATYPWTVANGNGGYTIKSGNSGIASSSSTISATFDLATDGTISFDAECMGEGTGTAWDKCIFTLDGAQQFSYGAHVSGWNNYSYSVAAGSHTCTWTYSKDSSVNPTGDYFMIDNVTITTSDPTPGPTPGPTPAAGMAYGPVINDAAIEAGTYYLVASSTTPDFEVTINAEPMPCPAVEGFAFGPTPADNEDEVEPGSVTLRWNIPAYATGWRLIFGSTYHPDPNHPQTIMYPEDGSFSTELANSYTVRNLWNNTNYFWHVEFNNGACPVGVSSPIWGFTTHLNIPQNLVAEDYTVFNDEQIVLHWNAVVDRTFRTYFIYRDGVKVGETNTNQIDATSFTEGPLAYNMGGYTYYVTAIYDEGESAPSDPVTVKVSGYGDVNGHVFEQDGTTGIAGATVTMVGTDEFGVTHTYNFVTNGQGYYSGHIYAGSYNGSAACEGYQTINAPVQGNPIAINYNETTSPIDYILDENFDAPCAVIAEYYPDSLDPNSPYVKVYWGCGLPGSEIIEDFETGDFSMFDWQLDGNYPWSVVTTNPYEGTYCMKSGGAGVANVVSNMSVTVEIPADGLMSFFGKISCENNWDYGYFYIDGVQKGSYTGASNWVERQFDVTAGEHTFMWQYTKDGSVNSNDDCFYVDYINFYKQPEPPVPGMTYNFEDGTMQGWTSVDADGDGYGWYMGSEIMTGQTGNNSSTDFVLSQSYYLGTVLHPDNYLVSPQVQLGGLVRFYACAQDASYPAEHFGLAVSTTNTQPSSFTMIQEWTMTAKSVEAPAGKPIKDSRSGRAQGTWYEYTVDLSAYSGMGYVAIRHFNCSDMFYLNVDDITIGEPGGKGFEATRRLSHYNVYRTNCYNDGPYTEENTVFLATVWVPDTVYIDVEWYDLPAGVYKWGVSAVYAGNRGEEYESQINWTAPQAVNRASGSFVAKNGTAAGSHTGNVGVTNRDGWLYYDDGVNVDAIGLTAGGSFYWGVMFPGGSYTGNQLTKVSMYDYSAHTGNILIYQGGDTAPGTLVGTQAYTCTGSEDFAEWTLSTPVTIDPSQNLWIVMNNNDGQYVASIADYCGDDNGEWLSMDGTEWYDLYSATSGSIDGTWMIRAYTETGATPGPTPGPTPTPTPGAHGLAEPRQSEIVWSNCLDKDMYLDHVSVNVLLNSADSPEGTTVSFTNLNEYEQMTYGGYDVTLDESGYYLWDNFRKGEYGVKVEHVGYEPIVDTVSIWETTDLRYVMIEIIYGVENVYVSRTGWAMWDPLDPQQGGSGINPGPQPGPGGAGDTFSENCDNGMPAGWTTVDADGDGYTWVSSMNPGNYHNAGVDLTGSGHNASAHFVLSGSWINQPGQALTPDNYLVSPQVTIANGSTFSFWACAQDASYPADHFGVAISDNGTSDWTMVNEWTMTAKSTGAMGYGRNGEMRAQGNWYQYSVDLSAFAGQKYIAIRHFNCTDQFILNVDDIELTAGRDANERHLEYYKVMCTSIDGVPIFNHNTVHPFCQLSTNEPYNAPLVEGDHYLCKVAVMYSTGMSAWSEPVEWVYEPCEHWGPVDEVTVGTTTQGNHIEWVFEHGFNPYGGDTPGPGPGPQPGSNATVILTAGDVWGDGSGYQMLLDADANAFGTTIPETGALSTNCSGNDAIYAQFEYKIPTNADGNCATQNMVMNNSVSIEIPAGTYDWCITNPTPGDRIWIASAQGNVGGRQDNYVFEAGNTYEFTVSMLGSNDQVNVVITGGAKGHNAPMAAGEVKDMANVTPGNYGYIVRPAYSTSNMIGQRFSMTTESSLMFNIGDIANYDERVYFLYKLMNDNRFSVVNAEQTGMFVVNGTANLNADFVNFIAQNIAEFTNIDKYQAADMAREYKSMMPASMTNALMLDLYVESRENNMCEFADPFCTDNGMYEFPAGVNAGSGESGPDYDCLYTQPNPAWYYMRIGDPGSMDIHMFSTPEVDIDFCCWGPFDDPTTPCPNGLTEDKVVSCSYSTSWTEHCMIPATAQTGEYYILVITNYSNQPCNINFSMVAGSGSTDCGILPPVDIIGFLITQDGEYLAFVGPTDREYTDIDEFGDHEYCVRPIYPGEMTLPDHNYGWSMGCPVCEFSNGGPAACAAYMPIHGEAMPATDQVKIWWGDQNPGPGPQPGGEGDTFSYNFDDSQMPAGWTAHDEDGDGFGWILGTACDGVYLNGGNLGGAGHNSSADLICSGSYSNVYGALTPDNWLISPTLTLGEGSVFSFWACGQDAGYVAEHFGVAVSEDNGNSFTMVQEWTMTAKNGGDVMTIGRNGNTRAQGTWHQYTVDLGAYAGEGRKIALRHFNCTDMFILDVDDLELTNGSKSRADIVNFKVYRSTDNNDYALIGTVPYVDGQTYYEYIDTPAGAGTYYYQVTTVYSNECESVPALSFDDPTQDYVVVGVTGLNENDGKVALYPNPTKGNVTIQATGMNHITVVSVLGQVIYDAEVDADEFTLNMSQFNAGMYTVRISTTDGVAVRRVTVIR